MLSGMVLAITWCLIFLVATAETALVFASQTRLKEVITAPKRRELFLRYFERAPAARPFCVLLRVAAISTLFFTVFYRVTEYGSESALYWFATAGAAALAELGGRYVGKRWPTPALMAMLPLLQVPGCLAGLFRKASSDADSTEARRNSPDEQVVDAALEEIRVAIKDAASEGAIHRDEKDMIEGVLKFEDVEVQEIMTPRTEMECVDADGDEESTRSQLASFHHTRIPVYEGVRDKIVGVLHVKDLTSVLIAGSEECPLNPRELMQKSFFVPETKRAMSLLHDFKQRHLQIAIILDEYGGVTGLVTMEDIMEQIVGELEEGFEAERIEDRIRVLGGGALDVDARLHVDEVNELLHADLPEDEDYDTIGGFLLDRFASVPQKGESLECNGVRLEVLDSNDRRVHRVMIKKCEEEGSER